MFNDFKKLLPSKNLRKISSYKSKYDGFSNLINYFGLIEDGVMINVDGSIMSSYWFRGYDMESSTASQLAAVSSYANNGLMNLDEGYIIHVDQICYESNGYINSNENSFPDSLLEMIDNERRFIYESEGRHFERAYILTITWLPPSDIVRQASKVYVKSKNSKKFKQSSLDDILEKYHKTVDRVLDRLDVALPFIRKMNNQELMTYLNRCITGKSSIVHVPKNPMYLQQIFANQDFIADSYPKIGKKYIQVVAITGFPMESYPGIMDQLNTLGFEYRWTTRFIFIRNDKAKKLIDKIIKFWAASRMDIKGWIVTTFNPGAKVTEDPNAVMKAEDALSALAEVSGNYVKAGFYTSTITIFEDDLELAIARAEEISTLFDNIGFKSRVETLNSVDAYFGSLPGYGYQNVRKPTLNTLVLSDLLPLTAIWAGLEKNPCPLYQRYNTPPLMITSSGLTPFRVNLHVDDVGHTFILGPTGSGKSTLVSNIIAQHFRYKFAKVFAFDQGKSLFPLCAAINGNHYDLLNDESIIFKPLQPPKLDENGKPIEINSFISWATSWIEDMCRIENVEINITRSKIIYEALERVLSQPDSKNWRMDELHSSIQGDEEVKNVISKYTSSGLYKYFDGHEDVIAKNNFTVFEMSELMNTNNEALIFTTITYLFEKIKQQLTGSPTMIILEECWIFLKNKHFAKKIDEWLRLLRKANVVVVIVSQNVTEIIRNPEIAPIILNSCPTKIFLSNPDATGPIDKPAYQAIGLNETEIEIIQNLTRKREYFFRNPIGKRVFSLNLGQETPIALSFTGRTGLDDIKEAQKIKKEFPNEFAYEWLKYCGHENIAKKLKDLKNINFELE